MLIPITKYAKIFIPFSANNLFEVLYISQNDPRFNEWLNCFELILKKSSNLIYEEYFEIRNDTKYYNIFEGIGVSNFDFTENGRSCLIKL